MKSLWNDEEVGTFETDLDLRVYSSNLLGQSDELVLHGGGNTSLKKIVGDDEILYIKGSGWDLSTIKKEGFAPVKLKTLKDMAKLESLSDSEMVRLQKAAMIDKTAPNPSVEAILHAIIPYKFVDHSHADAVVTITNSKNGEKLIKELFNNFLIIPYVMPGFSLAKKIYEMTLGFDWSNCDGIILLNHGIFTFDNYAKKSYEKMIKAVTIAEEFLDKNAKADIPELKPKEIESLKLKELIDIEKGYKNEICINSSSLAIFYSKLSKEKLTRGVLTPEHIIRTKRHPLVVKNSEFKSAIEQYADEYKQYFKKYAKDEVMLNPAPNYAVVEDFGVITFGKTQKEADIINDLISHTMIAVLRADKLGGYESIGEKDSFDMEYWELEQAKLRQK